MAAVTLDRCSQVVVVQVAAVTVLAVLGIAVAQELPIKDSQVAQVP